MSGVSAESNQSCTSRSECTQPSVNAPAMREESANDGARAPEVINNAASSWWKLVYISVGNCGSAGGRRDFRFNDRVNRWPAQPCRPGEARCKACGAGQRGTSISCAIVMQCRETFLPRRVMFIGLRELGIQIMAISEYIAFNFACQRAFESRWVVPQGSHIRAWTSAAQASPALPDV